VTRLAVSRGFGGGGRFSPETAAMARLAGIDIPETSIDGRRSRINPAAVATSRLYRRAAAGNGDPHRGSVDQFAIAQMLRGGRR
jgi:hypothetical protein